MVLERAELSIRPGQGAEFEQAFRAASGIISAVPGFAGLSLTRCLERDGVYLLLVRWERLEDHTEGFRGSAGYQQWRELLHHFYDPFPVVEHFAPVLTSGHPVP
ncbi:antibiotic biosynthesis monooxygenase family protein [Blastococcus xanthinilyticus]|nr:antibiotic biosynthesis monooxygenase [Blastococcus xanthinilyticus]